jgi:Ankyrin repeats (3 copies)
VILNRLIHLGFLFILYEYSTGLEEASKPPLHTDDGHTISSDIRDLVRCTGREVKSTLKAIIALIEVEGKSSELQALRYREALDTVEDINKLGSANRSGVFVELEITILNKLIQIYEDQNDDPTVRRFSLRRSMLRHGPSSISNACHVEHTAQCWVDTCGKLPALLDSLDLQIEKPFHVNGTPSFPAQQSALRCGYDDIANVLCKLDGAFQNLDILKQDPTLAAAAVGKLPPLDTHVRSDKGWLKRRDVFQRTVLFYTACRGNLETFVTLVNFGANAFDRDAACQSVLGAACAAGNKDIVRWLLERGHDPNDHYLGSRSPIHDAARGGHTDICLMLLQKGAHVDYLVDHVTPAQVARTKGFIELASMLETFLDNPANQYSYKPAFSTPNPRVQPHDTASSDVRDFEQYVCPLSLPSHPAYEECSPEDHGEPNIRLTTLTDPSPTEEEAGSHREAIENSFNVYESSRLFGS